MATLLLAVVIAVAVAHVAPDLGRLRNFEWLTSWVAFAQRTFGEARFWRGAGGVALVVGVPVVALLLVQVLLDDAWFGLFELVLGAIVLFYCWGPRDLDLDVEAVAGAPDAERRDAALRSLAASGPPPAPGPGVLVDTVFREALRRWFGVLFWFVVLGPAGALGYRIVQLLARDAAFAGGVPPEQATPLEKLAQALDWPAAHLMTLALAVAADFDAVASAWRDFHAARDRTRVLDTGFLYSAGRASVDADIDDGEGYADGTRAQLAEMQEAMALAWRILLVWGVVFALFVLAGKIA
jgi:AmpE protein